MKGPDTTRGDRGTTRSPEAILRPAFPDFPVRRIPSIRGIRPIRLVHSIRLFSSIQRDPSIRRIPSIRSTVPVRSVLPVLLGAAVSVIPAHSRSVAADRSSSGPPQRSGSAAGATSLESLLDSLRTQSDSLFHWEARAGSPGWTGGDTTRWIPEATPDSIRRAAGRARFGFGLLPRVGDSKVEGFRLGVGPVLRWTTRPAVRVEGDLDRAFAWGKWEGDVRLGLVSRDRSLRSPAAPSARITGGSPEGSGEEILGGERRGRGPPPWEVVGAYRHRAVPFGGNRPYGNVVQALLLSLDHQAYLEREEAVAGLFLRFPVGARFEFDYVKRSDQPQPARADPLWNTDPRGWENPGSDAGTFRGAIVTAGWEEGAGLGAATSGIRVRAAAWGSALGGDREFYTVGTEIRHRWTAPGAESIDLEFWGGLVGGDPPLQDLADLGGESSLRAYPPRAFVGSSLLLARLDWVSGVDVFRRLRTPLLERLSLQPVVFADLGAVWSPERFRVRPDDGTGPVASDRGLWSLSAIEAPASRDWRSDWGIGVQRYLGFTGFLQRIRLSFAWRTDRSRDRLRATLLLLR